jgi:hypothetical protein
MQIPPSTLDIFKNSAKFPHSVTELLTKQMLADLRVRLGRLLRVYTKAVEADVSSTQNDRRRLVLRIEALYCL